MVFDTRKNHYNDYLPIKSSISSITPGLPNDITNTNTNESQPSITLRTSTLSDQVMIPNAKKLPNTQNTISDIHITADQKNSYGCNYSSASETGEKCQGSKNTTKDNVGSEDAITDENINNDEHEDKSDYEDSSATKTGKKRQGSKKASEDESGSEDVRADGSATNEEQQDEADYEDSSASEHGKNIKEEKVHLKMMLPLKMQLLMEMQLLKNRIMILTLKIQVLVKMEKNDKKVKIHLKTMLPLKMQMQVEMQLLRNRSIILTMKIPMIMKMEKKFMVVKMHPKMTLPLKKTHRMLFREN